MQGFGVWGFGMTLAMQSLGCGVAPVVAEAHDVLGRRSAQCDRRVPRAEAHVLGRRDRDCHAHLVLGFKVSE